MKIEIIDYFIVAVFVAFLFYVGFKAKKQIRTANDFFLAGSKLPGWAIAISLFSLGLGAFELIGLSAMTVDHGMSSMHYFWMGTAPAIAFLILCVIPVFHKAKIKSLPEYLGRRFDSDTRLIASYVYITVVVLFSSLNLFLGAKVLNFFCPLPPAVWIIVLCAIAAGYVALGGLTATILNSVLLVCVIILAILPLSILGLAHFGSWEKMTIELMDRSYFELWKPLLGLNSLGLKWDFIFTGMALGLGLGVFALDYAVIQRVQSINSEKDAKSAALTNGYLRILAPILVIFPALVAQAASPVLKTSSITDANFAYLLVPSLMSTWYPAGMLGVGIAGYIACVLCSVQAALMVFSTSVFCDVKNMSEQPGQLNKGRKLTVAGACVIAAVALIVNQFPSSINYIQTIFTFIGVPLTAICVCGLLLQGCTTRGAKAGLIGGVIVATLHFLASILSSVAPNLMPLGLGPILSQFKTQLHYFGFRSVFASNLSRAFFVFIATVVISLLASGKQDKTDNEELNRLTFHLSSIFHRDNRGALLSLIGLSFVMIILNVGMW